MKSGVKGAANGPASVMSNLVFVVSTAASVKSPIYAY
jgi:hypothetical protein